MTHDPRPQRRTDPASRGAAPLNPLLAVLLACGAVAVLFVAGAAAERYTPSAANGSAGSPGSPTSPAPRGTSTQAKPPAIGSAVRDGKFEFVVSKVDCSHTTLGVEHLKRTAKGKYCVVSLSVRNIADGSQFFLGHAQKAYDASGVVYRNDEIAGIYANHDTQTFLQRLSPGQRVTGKLVFDVPKPVRLTSLELHDSLLSRGVRVNLR